MDTLFAAKHVNKNKTKKTSFLKSSCFKCLLFEPVGIKEKIQNHIYIECPREHCLHEITSSHHLTPYKPTREKVKEYLARTGASISTRYDSSAFQLDPREHPVVKLASVNNEAAATSNKKHVQDESSSKSTSGLKIVVKSSALAAAAAAAASAVHSRLTSPPELIDENNNQAKINNDDEETNMTITNGGEQQDKLDVAESVTTNEDESTSPPAPASLQSVSNVSE